jgi:Tol biopolymer transport system component/C-terminal processing protease CtpA/Prc
MKHVVIALMLGLALQGGAVPSPPSFAEPGISPDGREIAFVSGADIWTVPASGGEARLLISHPAADSRPLYSPDGARIAFTSTRTGNGDVYVLTLSTGDVSRLTYDDAAELVNGWSPDGRWVYFSSAGRDIGSMNDVLRVEAHGGTPMPVAADRYATEYFAAASPDGGSLAITARGFAGAQWWRKGHSHLDESEIWIVRQGTTPAYEQVTQRGAKNAWPMWSADGRTLYYMSDRNGTQNIWKHPVGAAASAVTTFKDGHVLWPTISRDGATIAFEREFDVWTLDTASGRVQPVRITRRGAPATHGVERLNVSDQLTELALSPDGKKIAVIGHGEVFSASAKEGGDAQRVTFTPGRETQVTWAPDSRRIVYVSTRGSASNLHMYDFVSGTETPVTTGPGFASSPRFSPDGTMLAYQRNARELHVIDLSTKADRTVARAPFDTPPFVDPMAIDWSPDSKYLAFFAAGSRMFQNVHVVEAAGGEARQVSFLANAFSGSIAWGADGTYLMFQTRQRTEPGRVVRVDLVPRTPKFREDQFRDLFRQEAPARPADTTSTPRATPPAQPPAPGEPAPAGAQAKPDAASKPAPKPVAIDFERIRRRVSVIPVGLDVDWIAGSPDGKWLALIATAAGQESLYVYSLDELSKEPAVARQLTSTPGAKRFPQFTPDSKELLYLDRGRVYNVTLERREPKAIAVDAQMDVDFRAENHAMFAEAWTWLRDTFFDEKFNGVDWDATRARYEPRAAAASNPDETRRIISLMVGELNASHSGVSAPPRLTQTVTGRLGLTFDRAEYESSGRLEVASVLPLGPAALAREIGPGDVIAAVEGREVDRRTNIDSLLQHTIGRRVALRVQGAGGRGTREVVVRPVNQNTEKGLMYRDWVEQRRSYVERISNGALGYVHMYDMSGDSLNQLFIDLDTDNHSKKGVVVDVRNNNGGFVNVYAIDTFARRGYFSMAYRGLPPTSSRHLLGQRALELPTILLTNQHSLSDAEDFTEGYRTLKLGKVVGEPTAGWIIYTSNQALIDGSVLRLPFIRITASDGSQMEMNPRPVDVPVARPMGESYTSKDVQLDAAVRELLAQLGTSTDQAARGREER